MEQQRQDLWTTTVDRIGLLAKNRQELYFLISCDLYFSLFLFCESLTFPDIFTF